MGFFDVIIRIFKGTDFDKKSEDLEARITELRREKSKLDCKLGNKKISDQSYAWYSISATSENSSHTSHFINFQPPTWNKITSMEERQETRIKEYKERIRTLSIALTRKFDEVQNYINSGNTVAAEKILLQNAFGIKEVNDEQLNARFMQLQEEISQLKEELRRKEIERKVKEERKKQAEAKRIAELQRRKEEQAAKKREERERKAREYEEKLAKEEAARQKEIERLKAQITIRKIEANEILDYLRQKGVPCFYHFTDERNLPSIRKMGGLYSWYYCQQNDIKIPNPGGDTLSWQLDSRKGLQDYVRLSFCNDHPMAYRKKQEGARLILLEIKVDVAVFKETKFSDINAADGNASFGKEYTDLQNVNISATKRHYVGRNDPDFKQHQAECMVKTFIPIEFITNISNPNYMS